MDLRSIGKGDEMWGSTVVDREQMQQQEGEALEDC